MTLGVLEGLPDLPESFFQDPDIKAFACAEPYWATYNDNFSQRKFTERDFELAKLIYLEGVNKRQEVLKEQLTAGRCECAALQIAEREAETHLCNRVSNGMLIAGLFEKLSRASDLVTTQEAEALKKLVELLKNAPDRPNKDAAKLRERDIRIAMSKKCTI